ncbi:hypothetical protein [Flexithrix dorotheae]|uniref:hypothetical protein n=1 Tax=Flexithrix dorotheae TaxID=70993 RepID=UPI000372943E|nr:hypothetical protein [Flexithrix dorotheae]
MTTIFKNLNQLALLIAINFCLLSCNDQFVFREEIEEEAIKPVVKIKGEDFYINNKITLEGIEWRGFRVEGLLPNARLVNGIFDDSNPETQSLWAYPDTKTWDPERNTDGFIASMSTWKAKGLLGFTINMQGGSPHGYSAEHPWNNSPYEENGDLKPEYMNRLKKILDRAEELEMVPILGLFYFGQDERLKDEQAVKDAVDNVIDWLFDHDYKNVLIEVNNECTGAYDHAILQQERVHELILQIQSKNRNGFRYLVSTSYGGKSIPKSNVVEVADFILLHGNGITDPREIVAMVEKTKNVPGYTPKPIVFNEDDHYEFEKGYNNFASAISAHASWGFFDYRRTGEEFENGFQSVPVDWRISSERKQAFFDMVEEISLGEEIIK